VSLNPPLNSWCAIVIDLRSDMLAPQFMSGVQGVPSLVVPASSLSSSRAIVACLVMTVTSVKSSLVVPGRKLEEI